MHLLVDEVLRLCGGGGAADQRGLLLADHRHRTDRLATGDGWQEVRDAGATRLLITVTVPGRAPYDPRISVLSVRPLLERWLAGVDPGQKLSL